DRSRCRSIPRARAGAAAAAWGRDRPAARPGRRSEVVPPRPLPGAGAAEAPGAPFARGEFLDDVEADLQDGDDQQLGDPFEGLDREGGVAAVPDRYHQLALVVRIDQADEVPEDEAMLVAEAGARQYQRGEARIADVDRDAGRHQCARPRGERQRLVEAGAKVEAGAARAAVGGQPLAHPGVEDLEFDFHAVSSVEGRRARRPAWRPIASPATSRMMPGIMERASGAIRPRPRSRPPMTTRTRENASRRPGPGRSAAVGVGAGGRAPDGLAADGLAAGAWRSSRRASSLAASSTSEGVRPTSDSM